MAYYDKNFLTFVGNVANKQILLHKTPKGVPFAFVTLINHVVFSRTKEYDTVVECVAWRQRAVNLTQYRSGDKLEIHARLHNGEPITDQNGYQQTTVVPTINTAHRIVYMKKNRNAPANNQGNYPNNNYPNRNQNNYPRRNQGNYPQGNNDPFAKNRVSNQSNSPFPSSPFANNGNNSPAGEPDISNIPFDKLSKTNPLKNKQNKPKGQAKSKPSAKGKPSATGKKKSAKTRTKSGSKTKKPSAKGRKRKSTAKDK